MRQLKINLLIYDAKFHKLEEIWSHSEMQLTNVNQLLKEVEVDDSSQAKKTRTLKFESNDARMKYRIDDDDEGQEVTREQTQGSPVRPVESINLQQIVVPDLDLINKNHLYSHHMSEKEKHLQLTMTNTANTGSNSPTPAEFSPDSRDLAALVESNLNLDQFQADLKKSLKR